MLRYGVFLSPARRETQERTTYSQNEQTLCQPETINVKMTPTPVRPRRRGSISTQCMMFLIFVVFPASWTAIAPVSRITLERKEVSITATSKRCMFFFVPYYTQRLTNIATTRVDVYEGSKLGFNSHLSEADNRPSRRGYSEANAELVLANNQGDEVRSPIDLAYADTVQSDIEAFIASQESRRYSVNLVANRILYFLSFPIVLLTVVYLLLQGLAITRLVLGNPYWPFDVRFAHEMKVLTEDLRDNAKKR